MTDWNIQDKQLGRVYITKQFTDETGLSIVNIAMFLGMDKNESEIEIVDYPISYGQEVTGISSYFDPISRHYNNIPYYEIMLFRFNSSAYPCSRIYELKPKSIFPTSDEGKRFQERRDEGLGEKFSFRQYLQAEEERVKRLAECQKTTT